MELPNASPSENFVSVIMPEGQRIFVDQSEIKLLFGERVFSFSGRLFVIRLRENSGIFYAVKK